MKKLWVKISGELKTVGRAINRKTNKGINFPLLVRHFKCRYDIANGCSMEQISILQKQQIFGKSPACSLPAQAY